jgi:transcriptional regulator with XRE-family HTH domain
VQAAVAGIDSFLPAQEVISNRRPDRPRHRNGGSRLSQAALGDKIGVTQGAVSSWETGRIAPPHEQVEALARIFGPNGAIPATSPSQDYGEWLRERREAADLTREQLAAQSGVSAVQIYNIETGRSTNPREKTRDAFERALDENAPRELVQAVEDSAEIKGVGQMTDFDPHSEDDFPREPGVYVFYDVSDRPVYVGKSANIRDRVRGHVDKFWYRTPIVEKAAYVRVGESVLRGQLEETLIKFLKSNAVINQRLVDR